MIYYLIEAKMQEHTSQYIFTEIACIVKTYCLPTLLYAWPRTLGSDIREIMRWS